MNEHLARARQIADANAGGGISTSASPDDRTIPYLLAGILDALIAIAEQQANVPPDPADTQPTTDPANVPGRSDFEETL